MFVIRTSGRKPKRTATDRHEIIARFALNLLAPAPVASALLAIVLAIMEGASEILLTTLLITLYAYIFAGLPSIAHACYLHARYTSGLPPHSKHAVWLSTASGTLAGFVLGVIGGAASANWVLIFSAIALGAATGAINGLLQFLIHADK